MSRLTRSWGISLSSAMFLFLMFIIGLMKLYTVGQPPKRCVTLSLVFYRKFLYDKRIVPKQKITSAPSVRRMPSYLHIIRQIQREGCEFISGTLIAQELNLEPIQVRKDLSITGITGRPKKGYPVNKLVSAIERFLGWSTTREAVVVGAGNLGIALMGYQEFQFHDLRLIAAFDIDPHKVGKHIHGVPVLTVDVMESRIRGFGVKIAILTVPSSQAQRIATTLVGAGIEGIWNFTNVKLKVPDTVSVQNEDLSSGYAMLCVMMQERE